MISIDFRGQKDAKKGEKARLPEAKGRAYMPALSSIA